MNSNTKTAEQAIPSILAKGAQSDDKKELTNRERFLAGKAFHYRGTNYRYNSKIGVSGIIQECGTLSYKASVLFVGGNVVSVKTYFFDKPVATNLLIDEMEFLTPAKG